MKFFSSVIALAVIVVSATAAPAKSPADGHRATKALPDIDIRSPTPRTGNRGLTTSPQIEARANTSINSDAVKDTTCLDPTVQLDPYDTNAAILSTGAIQFCEGDPISAIGAFGTSKFTLDPVVSGASVTVSKGRSEGCVRAAQAVYPTETYTSTCHGGVSKGHGVAFTLSANE